MQVYFVSTTSSKNNDEFSIELYSTWRLLCYCIVQKFEGNRFCAQEERSIFTTYLPYFV